MGDCATDEDDAEGDGEEMGEKEEECLRGGDDLRDPCEKADVAAAVPPSPAAAAAVAVIAKFNSWGKFSCTNAVNNFGGMMGAVAIYRTNNI